MGLGGGIYWEKVGHLWGVAGACIGSKWGICFRSGWGMYWE